ncbi:MAG: hypothetical protein EA397_08715 [Deltaproteobacteria bacterium]|nr:MAG: hypothetical protein EA397_08715 [Deltaproteobacteria bacterium]
MSSSKVSPAVGILALFMGLWTGCGGCMNALSSLSSDPTDQSFALFGAELEDAMRQFELALQSQAPVAGAISLLASLVGFALLFAGIGVLMGGAHHAAIGRAAFLLSALVDGIQLLWALISFMLIWTSFIDYMSAVARFVDSGSGEAQGTALISGVALVVLTVGYYGIKIALGLGGAWASRQRGAEPEPPTEGLDWA